MKHHCIYCYIKLTEKNKSFQFPKIYCRKCGKKFVEETIKLFEEWIRVLKIEEKMK